MLKQRSVKFLLTSFSLVLTSLFAGAQSNDQAMEVLFSAKEKKEHRSYSLQYSNKGLTYCWIENDSLYTCSTFGGVRIALADIDFSEKNIRKDKMLVQNTRDNLYVLGLRSLPGKPMYSYPCMIGKITGADKLVYNQPINLDMESKAIAEQAFDYLQQLSRAGVKTSSSSMPAGNFEGRLATLINGLKDNFASLKKGQVKPGVFTSGVQLPDAVSTTINTGMMGSVFMMADFGNFNTADEALPVYNSIARKIESSKKLPVNLVRQQEIVTSISRTSAWLPLEIDPSMSFKLVLEMVESVTFDKDYNKKDVYFVTLKISRN